MPPRGRKHWCKHCKKSFPSGNSLGGHMALHRNIHKKRLSGNPSIDSEGYDHRESRWRTRVLSDSTFSDDEAWTLFPKTECQLCFKAFASCDALLMHMKIHSRREKKMVVEHKASTGDGVHNGAISEALMKKKRTRRMVLDTALTPEMMTYGIEEVGAAHILVMLSKDHGRYAASVDHDKDCEMDGNMGYHTPMAEMDLNSPVHGPFGDDELMEPQTSSSYEEVKFVSLSEVIKATTSHECKLCGKVFLSGRALGGHKKFHSVADRKRASNVPESAVTQPCKQLLELDHESLVHSLPAPNICNYSSRTPKSEPDPSWVASSLRSEGMLGVL
ncbi:uncharacterized protein LOC104582938 [Brachypodium distachyon]|uniref:C2H2-type domain-containing protein n=1 Tax=Brachypodium distachyon TaxID=15368 RepID=I1GQD7_BRADI|nr:uncharacterized protein LOC104582938 [Brachypodium distachyon]KQK14249.2 hypothetical protein BRADI_1g14950v3 [Brachypodium distachyon]|eukprot:XP_010232783.1 uncharacterized protein LOC104582938 [Brachypodium distachyon]